MNRHLIFVDTETNGLDPRVHDAWEVAWWNLTTGERGLFLPYIPDVGKFLNNGAVADLAGLRVSRFVERWTREYRDQVGYGQSNTEQELWELQSQLWPADDRRAVVMSAQPKFDLPFLSKLFDDTEWNREPWFYRAPDLGTYAMGKLDHPLNDPPGASTVAQWCGVTPGDHAAWNDVTSGGRCVLLLEEFGRLRRSGAVATWDEYRAKAAPVREEAIDQLIQGVVIPA